MAEIIFQNVSGNIRRIKPLKDKFKQKCNNLSIKTTLFWTPHTSIVRTEHIFG